jgi:hypothetical protein
MTRSRIALVEPEQAEDLGRHLLVFFWFARDECRFARSEVAGLSYISSRPICLNSRPGSARLTAWCER